MVVFAARFLKDVLRGLRIMCKDEAERWRNFTKQRMSALLHCFLLRVLLILRIAITTEELFLVGFILRGFPWRSLGTPAMASFVDGIYTSPKNDHIIASQCRRKAEVGAFLESTTSDRSESR